MMQGTKDKNALRYWRAKRGLSQENIAVKLGINRMFVSLWENDRALPTLTQMERLAEILDRPITQLFSVAGQ